jgi:signal peptidase
MKKVFTALGYVLLTTLIALTALFVLTAIPATGLESRVVFSGSMAPAIPTGSVVFTARQESYAVGDVVTFQRSPTDTPVTHRIIREEGEAFVTKGDANEDADVRRVAPENILGAVFFQLPYLGYILVG